MQCPSCQSPLADSVRFCSNCGTALSGAVGILPSPVVEERSAGFFGRIIAEMRATPLEWFVPLGAWRADRFWNVVWVKWFLFIAVFPMAVMQYVSHSNSGASAAIGLLALYFGLFWVFLLRSCLQPERFDRFVIAKVVGFTAVIGIALVLVLQEFPIARDFYAGANSTSTWWRLCGFVFGVGLLEETVKALPVFLFVMRGPVRVDAIGYAYVGALSGLAFGVVEAIGYSQQYALGNNLGALSAEAYLVVQVLRFITLPLLHASWTGFACVYMGAATVRRESSFALVAFGLLVPIVLHGVYDTFPGLTSLAIAAMSVLLFIAYVRGRARGVPATASHVTAPRVECAATSTVSSAEPSVAHDRLAPAANSPVDECATVVSVGVVRATNGTTIALPMRPA